jgi:hypothetical protein
LKLDWQRILIADETDIADEFRREATVCGREHHSNFGCETVGEFAEL